MNRTRAQTLEHYAAQSARAQAPALSRADINRLADESLKRNSPQYAAIGFVALLVDALGGTGVPALVELIEIAREAA